MSIINQKFTTAAFRKIHAAAMEVNPIDYRSEWANGTGYMNGAVVDNGIDFNGRFFAASVDHDGRRILIVKSNADNIVVFERYSNDDSTIIVRNASAEGEAHVNFEEDNVIRYKDLKSLIEVAEMEDLVSLPDEQPAVESESKPEANKDETVKDEEPEMEVEVKSKASSKRSRCRQTAVIAGAVTAGIVIGAAITSLFNR